MGPAYACNYVDCFMNEKDEKLVTKAQAKLLIFTTRREKGQQGLELESLVRRWIYHPPKQKGQEGYEGSPPTPSLQIH